ncbi:MAG: tRNA (N6-isopentenyl adenosine(37)-C2)-methylthiotransferase MiaB [Eubacteriales bacterium]|nr:tRNA (N6-isopentenyl adenosine(37)-C2)-methylthiotransferase MiaB [Eubacteriales bacterium]
MDEKKIPSMEPDRQYYFMNCCKELILQRSREAGRTLTYNVQTFGCQMNAHDSEKLKGILDEIGYEETESENADFVICNTCTVRENANQKLYGHLGHIKNIKSKRKNMIVCLCGCMMQEPHVIKTIKEKYRYVDIVFGTHNIYKLAELIYRYLSSGNMVVEVLEKSDNAVEALPQKRKYRFKSGVNIMYGCNNFCTYCIVPYVRGREKSREPQEILDEIRCKIASGVKEVMLLGQNVNSYGKKFDYSDGKIAELTENQNVRFPELLNQVCKIDGLERVRFMTSHPKDLSDELISTMANNPKICKHLHLPVQSGSTDILQKMNRRYTKEQYLALVDKIREAMPDISLTTDIMVGFPGETEEDFMHTMDIVERVGYDQVFTFIYSKRTNTPAAGMDNQVPEEIVKDRFSRLLELVNKKSNERISRFSGMVKDVLVEEINHQDQAYITGRTEENVTVHFPGDANLIGQIVPVRLDSCMGFYYLGEMMR